MKDILPIIVCAVAVLGLVALAAYIGINQPIPHPCIGWESATVLDAPTADAGTHRAFACVEWK
jgi:hypothetical protein